MRQTHHHSNGGQARAQGAAKPSLYDDITDQIVAELEAGAVPWVKPWTSSGAALGLPRSAATRRAYSGINVLILWDAVLRKGYAAQEWLTFKQALALGGHVRKGERGTTICYADTFVPREARDGAGEGDDELRRVPFLKRFTVFNVEQCEGLPPAIVAPPKPITDHDKHRAAEALIAATGAVIRIGGGEAFYHPREDFIRLPPGADFVSAADYYCTILHELGHWTAHPTRLSRDLTQRFGDQAYAREELIAELCSAFLCAHFGIVPQVRHAGYIDHWRTILKVDARAIFHAASQASRAADFLLAYQQSTEQPPQIAAVEAS